MPKLEIIMLYFYVAITVNPLPLLGTSPVSVSFGLSDYANILTEKGKLSSGARARNDAKELPSSTSM